MIGNVLWALMAAAAGFAPMSCDVHEFPAPKPEPGPAAGAVSLTLSFDRALVAYDTLEVATRTPDYDSRHIAGFYRISEDGNVSEQEEFRAVWTESSESVYRSGTTLTLPEGRYRVVVWSDRVAAGSQDDLFYGTTDLGGIRLASPEYTGNTDGRDAFRGTAEVNVSGADTVRAEVRLERPQARYRFVTTDLEEFVTRVQRELAAATGLPDVEATKAVDLSEFEVLFHYTGYLATEYDASADEPTDAATGVWWRGALRDLGSGCAELGFDWVFVNGRESSVQVSVEIRDASGLTIARTGTLDVPVARGGETTVRGRFLTADASGGVGIDPDFEGDWNFEIR